MEQARQNAFAIIVKGEGERGPRNICRSISGFAWDWRLSFQLLHVAVAPPKQARRHGRIPVAGPIGRRRVGLFQCEVVKDCDMAGSLSIL